MNTAGEYHGICGGGYVMPKVTPVTHLKKMMWGLSSRFNTRED